MKKVIIVAPQFPPCNLTAAHRSRYFAMHLSKFGWETMIITVKSCYYQGKLDCDLESLLPADLNIIRTKSLPNKFLGVIGDLGVRSLFWHYKALVEIIKQKKIDLIYIPIPPNYSAILGPIIYKKFNIPYGIDYIDPWININGYFPVFSKGWWSDKLAKLLEPIVLKNASFVTAVAPGYYQGALERYPWFDKKTCFSMPYGAEEEEFKYLDKNPRPVYLFNPDDNNFHVVYAGAMLPKAYPVLESVMQALVSLKGENLPLLKRLRFHFIGTGSNPADSESYNIKPLAEKYNLSDIVLEHPARIPYLDVLNHLKQADLVLILGSTEPHYTPSKVFQAVLSRQQVLAFLHKDSTAINILEKTNAGEVIIFEDESSVVKQKDKIKDIFVKMTNGEYQKKQINWQALKVYSAEMMAKKLANIFNLSLK